MTFMDFDICHLPATLRMTLTYLFAFKYFKCQYLKSYISEDNKISLERNVIILIL